MMHRSGGWENLSSTATAAAGPSFGGAKGLQPVLPCCNNLRLFQPFGGPSSYAYAPNRRVRD
jgi:hypothetical protein